MKLTRYDGHVPLFSQNMEGRERTLFGSTVQDDDINNQFTPEFLRGWGSVGSTEFPTLQDFNALAYTHSKLLSYLYQAGIPSYSQNEEYYIGSIVKYNKDIYICLRDNPTVLPTDTNAWKRVQESLTFVGKGPRTMLEGAFGWGGDVIQVTAGEIWEQHGKKSQIVMNNSLNSVEYSSYAIYLTPKNAKFHSALSWHSDASNIQLFIKTNLKEEKVSIFNTGNTRNDKNGVIHAGTTTPINTLNVSDMSQEVIDNDLLTVTSGAVYRALQPKADSTYVNTELNKKITGGDVVQTTGQSTVDVMSQKTVTNLVIRNNFQDVTSSRVLKTIYTNNTLYPIDVMVSFIFTGVQKIIFESDGVQKIISEIIATGTSFTVCYVETIMPSSSYSLYSDYTDQNSIINLKWYERTV